MDEPVQVGQLFQQFSVPSRKPFKRLIGFSALLHRAEAAVLMRSRSFDSPQTALFYFVLLCSGLFHLVLLRFHRAARATRRAAASGRKRKPQRAVACFLVVKEHPRQSRRKFINIRRISFISFTLLHSHARNRACLPERVNSFLNISCKQVLVASPRRPVGANRSSAPFQSAAEKNSELRRSSAGLYCLNDYFSESAAVGWVRPRDPRAALKTFGYLRDRLFLASCLLYAANRWVLKPHVHNFFIHGYFDDVLLIARCALPPLLLMQRWLGLRKDDRLPTAGEIALNLVVWSILFEVIGPHIFRWTTGDPWGRGGCTSLAGFWPGALVASGDAGSRRLVSDEL